jgi:hypothetical protein
VTGSANVGGPNNSGNDPSGAGNAAKTANTPGTNSAGTANSAGSTSGGGAPIGSTTVGTSGNPAGGATGGRIDGTVTSGPAMQGDDAIRAEDAQDSKVDKKIKSICKGCWAKWVFDEAVKRWRKSGSAEERWLALNPPVHARRLFCVVGDARITL